MKRPMPTPGKKSARKAPVSASRPASRSGASPRVAKSSARSTKARAPKQSRSAASAEWMRGMRVNTYTITLLAMIVLGVLTLAPRVQEWFVLRQQVAAAQAAVEQARQDVTTMQAEVKRWEDPVFIRSQARDRLYYVMPGEVSYLVMDADGVNTSDISGTVGAMLADQRNYGQISKSIKETRNNWVDSLVETVIVAGIDLPKAAKK
ncbi:MAG: septum formation initiator family protein [Rhodoluna sp.]|nr:septum formation initiator family protein [Rhodoluna sp.]